MGIRIKLGEKRPDVITSLACASILVGLVSNFASELPTPIKFAAYGLTLALGYPSIFLALFTGKNKKVRYYLIAWCAVIANMLFIGAVQSNFWRSGFNINTFLAQDLRYVMYIGVGIVLADNARVGHFHKLMKLVALISVIFGIFALLQYDFNFDAVEEGERLGLWSMSYILWWGADGVFAYSYASYRILKKQSKFYLFAFITYAILGVLFIKRACFVNVIFIIGICEFLALRKEKFNTKTLFTILKFVVAAIALIVILWNIPYTHALISEMLERFTSQGNYLEYDRADEAMAYFETTDAFDIIFGQGLGHYVTTSRELGSLHAGVYNIIYKGGLILPIMYAALILKSIITIIKAKKYSRYSLVCLAVAMTYALGMLYEGGWSHTVGLTQYITPIVFLFTSSKTDEDEYEEISL